MKNDKLKGKTAPKKEKPNGVKTEIYTMANMRADIAWFDQKGVSDKTAVAFIASLLSKTPNRGVKEFIKG